MNQNGKTILIFLSLCAFGVLGVVKLFGSTMSSKFNHANSQVISEVRFDGGDYQPTPRRAYKPYVPKHVPPPVQYDEPATYVNPATDTRVDHLSTFAIDVDTASYTQARNFLKRDVLPPANTVRVEEFVNYFRYDYPAPTTGAFALHVAATKSPFSSAGDTYLLRVGLQAKKLSSADRKPVHLTFLVDTSGSMGSVDKLPLAKEALKLLTRKLRGQDTVALVTYAGSTREVLAPTTLQNQQVILDAIDTLGAGGGTAMQSGMEIAYRLAMESFKPGHVNRVIVVSDGDANIGAGRHDQVLDGIHAYVEEGVTLSTIGVGMGIYNDTMMEQLANKGNGNYYYIDGMDEASKVFGEQVDGTLQVIAKDVKVQVDFDQEKVASYRLIGYENRDIADHDFRDDKVDAGEVGAGHTVTALYEVKLRSTQGQLASVRIRAKKPDGIQAGEVEFPWMANDIESNLNEADGDLQFAAAVAAFAEILRGSPYAEAVSLAWIEEVASPHVGAHPERREFLELVRRARALGQDRRL